jgi:dipeptidyl aminopeptidase/acylaminoacyl peptidase
LSATETVGGVLDFSLITVDGDDLYWLEGRPSEGGRQVLVRRDGEGRTEDLVEPPINVRTRVHEYGGGAYLVSAGKVAYSELSDQRLYLLGGGPITPEPPVPSGLRYADGRFLPDGAIVCVRESHGDGEPINEIVRIDPSGAVTVLATGCDFYSNPRPSPDGQRLLWLEWDHPNMPWDGTTLMTAALAAEGLSDPREIAGGPEESVFQPEWGPDGDVVFVSDRTGWWNLYRARGDTVSPIHVREADFGVPAWIFGYKTHGFLSGGRILTTYWEDGIDHLAVIGPDGDLTPLPDDLTCHSFLVTDGRNRAWFVGFGADTPSALYQLDLDEGPGRPEVVRANRMPVEPGYVPTPRVITFPTGDGEVAHAVHYPPANPGFAAPEGERPPLIVKIHGGPTSLSFPRLRPDFIFWTTRGFAVVDVNYRGSTGYGRAYRNRLRMSWGITDVEDAMAAARYLSHQGEADPDRLIITGGSAGGYTALAALAFGDTFSVGCSYFGVADLELLADDTHKFESRYLDGLVGTDRGEMRRRSPLYSVDQIDVPVILFQGLEDKVVPPEQAEVISAGLSENGVPHAHITYEGEDHGFRRAETITHSLESELAFYGKVLGFRPHDDLPEVALVEA